MDIAAFDHSRTILHFDIDCFYAQVETNKNPSLKNLPVGIQQKNLLVTSNYIAREYGIKKCMSISDAKVCCPNLIIVNGEDLQDYRRVSYQVTNLLHNYSSTVERLGLDENFIDVTPMVNQRLKAKNSNKTVGNIFGDTSNLCGCGCTERLQVGSHIAQEIRERLKIELNLTTCAGIAHNKLLAKLVGAKNKPNQQTIVFPNSAFELIQSLETIKDIPWIGNVTAQQLEQKGIVKVIDLQEIDLINLTKIMGPDKAKHIKDVSFGIDCTPVKNSGKPQSIGLEDSCKIISVEKEIEEKLRHLLNRLLLMVSEDGRIPKTIKLTVRKYDKNNPNNSSRETRQCNVNSSFFAKKSDILESNKTKIMNIIMTLFKKIVDTKRMFHITLLGLSFTKFVEKPNIKNTLNNFLSKDIEVQSITDFINSEDQCCTPPKASTSNLQDNTDSETEPTPKKGRFQAKTLAKRHLNDDSDTESPSKLKVAELRLSSTDTLPEPTDADQNILCPPNIIKEVFNELPHEVQVEIWEDYRRNKDREKLILHQSKKAKPNSILNYLVQK